MKMQNKYALAGALFISPSFLYYLFIFLYPLILCIYNSFNKVNLLMGINTFIGITNYINLFERADLYKAVVRTVVYVLITVPSLLAITIWVANALAQIKNSFSSLLVSIVFLPFIVSMVSAGIVWDWLFDPSLGLINNILKFLHISSNPPGWLRATNTALISTVIITIWIRCPFSIMILYGGIKNVPEELYEVADLDGISRMRRFFSITLPLINPQIVLVFTLETIFAARIFDIIYVTTGGGPAGVTKTIMIYLIKDLFTQNYGMASALTVLILVVLFIISLLQQTILKRRIEF
jgi:ABC-type sugar transport system permease subunit